MKKIILFMIISVSFISHSNQINLLMVPDDPEAVRIGLDISSHKPSTILIKYKVGLQNTARLYGWKGTKWIIIPNQNYYEGSFFKESPNKTIIVDGYDNFPESLIPNKNWCDNVYKISTLENPSLIHLLGINLDFTYNDWKSFSSIYNISVSDLNPNNYNVRWYHKRLPDAIKSNNRKISKRDDIFWTVVRKKEMIKPTLSDYISKVSDKVDNIVSDDDMSDTDQTIEENIIIEENPLIIEPPEAVIEN